MISVNEGLPKDKQKVLIDTGTSVDPAEYNADQGLFYRYANGAPGDRYAYYYYSGVQSWMPFPEPSGKKGFVNEPELPFPAPDMRVPLSEDEKALLFPGKYGKAY